MLKSLLLSILLLFSGNCLAYTFNSCNKDQKEQIIESTKIADQYAVWIIQEKDVGIFIKWMGFNEINDIKKSFTEYDNILKAEYIDFYCDCDEELFAKSSKTIPHKVSICNKFWKAKIDGWDSRAGTIIHEVSHFKDLTRKTTDHFYDMDECLENTKTIEGQKLVIENANNYEYLAEDEALKH